MTFYVSRIKHIDWHSIWRSNTSTRSKNWRSQRCCIQCADMFYIGIVFDKRLHLITYKMCGSPQLNSLLDYSPWVYYRTCQRRHRISLQQYQTEAVPTCEVSPVKPTRQESQNRLWHHPLPHMSSGRQSITSTRLIPPSFSAASCKNWITLILTNAIDGSNKRG